MSAPELLVHEGWIIEWSGTEHCAGGCGQYGDHHEPSCGVEPIAKVADVVAALRGQKCCGSYLDPMCTTDGWIDGLIFDVEQGSPAALREALAAMNGETVPR